MSNLPSRSIDEYIEGYPPEIQKVLQALRSLIKAVAPDATERLSYGMPTFDLNGRRLVYFAGWKTHVGFYPISGGVAKTFEEELKPYRSGAGSARFSFGQPLPMDLIRRIVESRAEEIARGSMQE